MSHSRGHSSSGELIFNLWRNCFLPLRGRLSVSGDSMINFVQLSDSLVVYGLEPETVLDLVCDVYGRALVWGVPVRGGLAYGELFHLEDTARPGTAITLFGAGQIEAYETEQSAKGDGIGMSMKHARGTPEFHLESSTLNRILREDNVQAVIRAARERGAFLYVASPVIDELVAGDDDGHLRRVAKVFLELFDSACFR